MLQIEVNTWSKLLLVPKKNVCSLGCIHWHIDTWHIICAVGCAVGNIIFIEWLITNFVRGWVKPFFFALFAWKLPLIDLSHRPDSNSSFKLLYFMCFSQWIQGIVDYTRTKTKKKFACWFGQRFLRVGYIYFNEIAFSKPYLSQGCLLL